MSVLLVLALCASWIITWTWPWSGLLMGWPFNYAWARNAFHEMKYFYLPAELWLCIGDTTVRLHKAPNWVGYLSAGINFVCWLYWRNKGDDDDRWKRRRHRLAEKVDRAANGRLVVVPVGAR